jgi:hypothetical protein
MKSGGVLATIGKPPKKFCLWALGIVGTLRGSFMSNPDSRLDKYTITAACNDLYYYNDESFSLSED